MSHVASVKTTDLVVSTRKRMVLVLDGYYRAHRLCLAECHLSVKTEQGVHVPLSKSGIHAMDLKGIGRILTFFFIFFSEFFDKTSTLKSLRLQS